MRSRKSRTVTDRQVQALAVERLSKAVKLKKVGWKCTAQVVWQIVMLAAARAISVCAACRDLSEAPSDTALLYTLRANLPKRARTLEFWLESALCDKLPWQLIRYAREVAIDFHLTPYHGEPRRSARELYHSKSKSGTTKFHAYATACVVEGGFRYTLAATYVYGNEPLVAVLSRLLDRVRAAGVRIKTLLLDRQFCGVDVMSFLQSRKTPFLMPLMFRGRKAKPGKCAGGLRAMRRRPAGRYFYTWQVSKKKPSVKFTVVVTYKSFRHHRTKRRKKKKWLYAAWRVAGSPTEIREQYRRRFGIESSYRQLGQARIRTCTTDPVLRLFFVLVALVLRNVWVWLHFMYFAEARGSAEPTLHLECLRFKRMLNWIAQLVVQALHNGTPYCTELRL